MSPEARRAIGVRIETVRRRLDLTPRDFARMLGVSQEAVCVWEHGLGFRQDDLLLLAEATDTPADWLIEGLTDEDIEAGEEAGSSAAPFDPSRLFPRLDERVRVRRVMADEELPKLFASAATVRPDSLTAINSADTPTGGRARARPSALVLDLPGAALVSGARSSVYRLNRTDPANGGGLLLMSLALSGRRRFEQRGREVEVAERSAIFASDVDGSVTYDPSGRYVSVYLPTRSLLERVPAASALFLEPLVPDSEPTRLLSAYVASLMKSADGLTRSLAAAAADHIVDLCALMVGASGDARALAESRGVREARRCQIAEAIDGGAATPGFGPREVARQVGLTEREIHDLLWERGQSYSELVGDRRAAIACRRLADPRDSHLSIEEIAFLSGFMDFAKFRRAFTAQFGRSPTDVRHAALVRSAAETR